VKGRLRELRTQQGKDKIRILYFGDARRFFVLLHAVVKKTEKLEESDIRIAEERMEAHTKRIEGKSR
jgi:phage-related protein